jgi:DNA-binding PadR family transcriptional regulator
MDRNTHHHHPDEGFPRRQRHDGRPGRRGGPRVRRGDVRELLLAALVEGPAHGYQLMDRLEEASAGRWRPSPGSVYPTLQLLEDEGLVRGSESAGRRVYEITEEGRALAIQDRLADLAPDGSGSGQDHRDLREALGQLRLAVRQVTMAGESDQVGAAAEVIKQARQSLYRILAGDRPGGRAGTGAQEEPNAEM